ncbi:MAG: efflux RND transporter periplasmic adaptor subunit [Candidatus Eremiobacteraeota bacterium]|nr:efflux RND transporter periplasmic adaptor subunit [Candidatus Eremiobacteraeota bacterium]
MRYWSLIILLLLAACGGSEPEHAEQQSKAPVKVTSEELRWQEVPQKVEFAGTLVAIRKAVLSTRLSGWITYLRVEEGDFVHQGQTVVKVDVNDVEAMIRQAESSRRMAQAQTEQALAGVRSAQSGLAEARAGLSQALSRLPEAKAEAELARTDLHRMEMLYQAGALPARDYDRSKTAFEVAQARVAQLDAGIKAAQASVRRAEAQTAEAQAGVGSAQAGISQAAAGISVASAPLQYSNITSPIDGYVTRKSVQEGDMATPSQPLLEVQDTRSLWLEVAVPENQIGAIHLQQQVGVTIDALDQQMTGTVRHIVPSADPSSRAFTVKIEVPNPERKLFPGLYGRVVLENGSRKVLRVSPESVIRRGQLEGVFVIDAEQKARYRLVKLGEPLADRLEVLSGLEPGVRVVLNPPTELRDGDPVNE